MTPTPTPIRDWVDKGADSPYALGPDEVVARSQPRRSAASEGAAHFELANHLWRAGDRDAADRPLHASATGCSPTTGPTSARRGRSSVSDRVGGEYGRFVQGPLEGEEDSWPYESDFRSDVALLDEAYYPKTM